MRANNLIAVTTIAHVAGMSRRAVRSATSARREFNPEQGARLPRGSLAQTANASAGPWRTRVQGALSRFEWVSGRNRGMIAAYADPDVQRPDNGKLTDHGICADSPRSFKLLRQTAYRSLSSKEPGYIADLLTVLHGFPQLSDIFLKARERCCCRVTRLLCIEFLKSNNRPRRRRWRGGKITDQHD